MTFLEQFELLRQKTPHIGLQCVQNENSPFCQYTEKSKNCYMTFASYQNEDCLYNHRLFYCNDCTDCAQSVKSQLCYECVDCMNCYNCDYCQQCEQAIDSFYCYDCTHLGLTEECYEIMSGGNLNNCMFCTGSWFSHDLTYCELVYNSHACFGCVSRNHAEYEILNVKYTKEEYFKKVAEIKEEMKRDGSYGKWFASTYPEVLTYGYNPLLSS